MLLDKLIHADYKMYTKYSPGFLHSVITTQHKFIKIVPVIINTISAGITIIINLTLITLINPYIAIPTIITYTLLGIAIFYTNKKWEELDTKVDEIRRGEGGRDIEVDQIINGYAEVRAHTTGQQHLSSLLDKNAKVLQLLTKRSHYSTLMTYQIDAITDILTAGVLLYLIILLKDGLIASPIVVTLIMYIWRLINPTLRIVNSMADVTEMVVAGRKFSEVMDYENTVSDGSITLSTFETEIRFNHVSFAYDDSNTVLNDINLVIPKGTHIGICGTSGEGKSTLAKLIPKFYDVTDGAIEIDGIDIRQLSNQSLRSHIGIVYQEPYIFDTTIEENIQYGSTLATREELIEACKHAAIYDFIMTLPEKFHTNVGPKGLKLSGGQKQRIALARIFLANPDIIIMDEATSGLDNETETIVQDSLNMFKDKTMIVIAHWLSTIKDSDQIIVMGNHTIAESGTHEELLALNGVYKKLQK